MSKAIFVMLMLCLSAGYVEAGGTVHTSDSYTINNFRSFRVFEFTPKSAPWKTCIYASVDEGAGLSCFDKLNAEQIKKNLKDKSNDN